tara:strand:+ start:1145 stop:2074 length:930 start_codon:yes stop_codon:yes gene_type:complete
MGNRQTRKGEAFYTVITVFDLDGVARVSNQGQDDFELTFYFNGVEVQAPAYTITEIGSTGDYVITVTDGFDTKGLWTMNAVVTYNGSVWRDQIEVRDLDVDEIYSMFIAGGTGTEKVSISVTNAKTFAPVPGVRVNIYDDTATAFITWGSTGSDGIAAFDLDSGDYLARFFKPGFIAAEKEFELTAGPMVVDIEAAVVEIASPAQPNLCRLYADFIDQAGQPVESFRVQVTNLHRPSESSNLGVVQRVRTHETDANGHVEFDVVQGTRIRVNFVTTRVNREFIVPKQPSANLLTLVGDKKDAFAVVKAG